jgi:hypothetical protein
LLALALLLQLKLLVLLPCLQRQAQLLFGQTAGAAAEPGTAGNLTQSWAEGACFDNSITTILLLNASAIGHHWTEQHWQVVSVQYACATTCYTLSC